MLQQTKRHLFKNAGENYNKISTISVKSPSRSEKYNIYFTFLQHFVKQNNLIIFTKSSDGTTSNMLITQILTFIWILLHRHLLHNGRTCQTYSIVHTACHRPLIFSGPRGGVAA